MSSIHLSDKHILASGERFGQENYNSNTPSKKMMANNPSDQVIYTTDMVRVQNEVDLFKPEQLYRKIGKNTNFQKLAKLKQIKENPSRTSLTLTHFGFADPPHPMCKRKLSYTRAR